MYLDIDYRSVFKLSRNVCSQEDSDCIQERLGKAKYRLTTL